MAIGYVLYNKKAGNKESVQNVKMLNSMLDTELKFIDVIEIKDYKVFFNGLEEDDYIVLAGGDGTINHFINDTNEIDFSCDILYFPNGTGNDFANEMGYKAGSKPFSIKEHLKNLPSVTVNNKTYHFINGVGYGIDGYCCEVGDALKEKSNKPVNYTAIAIKGLLFHYKPQQATVTVDGTTHTYKKVWIAPTMYGKYYGGGMIPTPNQKRCENGTLSTMIYHGCGKLKALMVFPSIFKGEHVKHTEMVEVLEGDEITVTFERPTPLQIDGETILGVTSYTAKSARN